MEERNNIKDILRPIALMILIVFLYTNIVSPTYCKYIATGEDTFDLSILPENIEMPNIYLNSNLRVYLNAHKSLRGTGTTWNNLNEEEADGTIVRASSLNSVGGFLNNNDFYTFGAEHSGNNAAGNNYIRFSDSFDPTGSFTVESTLRFYPIPAISGEVEDSRRHRHYIWSNSDGGGIGLEVNYKAKGDELRFIAWIGDTNYLSASNRAEIEEIDHLANAKEFAILVSDYIPADGSILTVALRYDASTRVVNLRVKDAGDSGVADYLLDESITLGGTYKATGSAADMVIGGEPNGSSTDSYSAKFDLFTFRLYHAYLDDNWLYHHWRHDQVLNYSDGLVARFSPIIEAPNPNIVKEYWFQVDGDQPWVVLDGPQYTTKLVWEDRIVRAQILSYRKTYSIEPSLVAEGSPCRKRTPTFDYPDLTVVKDPIAAFLPVKAMSLRALPRVSTLTIDDSAVRYLDILELDFIEELGGWPLDTDLSLTFEPHDGYEMPSEIYVTLGEDVYVIDTAYENQYRYVYYYPDSNELWIEQPVFPLDTGVVKIEAVATKIGAAEDSEPTPSPTAEPTAVPSPSPTAESTAVPSPSPTAEPTAVPSQSATAEPTVAPTVAPNASPSATPTETPEPSSSAAPGGESKPEEEKTVTLNLKDVSNVTLEDAEGNVLANGAATLSDDGSLTVSLHTENDYELPESFSVSIDGTKYTVNTNGENNPEGVDFNPVTKELTISGDLLDGGDVEISFTIDAVVKPTKEEDGEDLGTEGDGNNAGGTDGDSGDGDDSSTETPAQPEDSGSENGESGSTETLPGENTPDALPEEGDNTGENTEGDSTGESSDGEETGEASNGEANAGNVLDDTPAEGTPDATPDDSNKDESEGAEIGNSGDAPSDTPADDSTESATGDTDTGDSDNVSLENSESADSSNADSGADSGNTDTS
ncbi:MAG: hypothetical protein IJO50_02970, partial [Clostridia bacterium]|nr:hypothetical protein [Clostridia bacterium]